MLKNIAIIKHIIANEVRKIFPVFIKENIEDGYDMLNETLKSIIISRDTIPAAMKINDGYKSEYSSIKFSPFVLIIKFLCLL